MTEQIGVEVLFDTKGATKGANQLSQSMTKMDNNAKGAAKSGMLAMGAAVALGNILTQGFNTLMGKMGSAIPALGETIGQASTVIFNNLFKPLSDVLMPLLVKLMNWVRDNRTGFVQLGSVISGAFKLLFDVASTVFGIIRRIADKFFGAITGGAKMGFKSIADFLNLVLLKISFIIQFALILIEPVLDTIANIIIWLGKSVIVPFFKGFLDGLSEIGGAFSPLFDAFGELWQAIKSIGEIFGENSGEIGGFFRSLGQILGQIIANVLKPFVLLITLIVKGLAAGIRGIKTFIDFAKTIGPAISNGFSNAASSIRQFFSDIVDWVINKFHSILDWFKELPSRIASSISGALADAKKLISDKLGFVGKKLFGGEPEPITTASGAPVSTNAADNRNQSATYNINVAGAQDTEATGKALLSQAQSKNSIQNQEAARGVR